MNARSTVRFSLACWAGLALAACAQDESVTGSDTAATVDAGGADAPGAMPDAALLPDGATMTTAHPPRASPRSAASW